MEDATSSIVEESSETRGVSKPDNNVAETAPAQASLHNFPGWTKVALVCLFLSAISSVASIAAYDHWYAQKVVAVDLKGYITEQRDKYVAGKITDEELRGSLDRLEQVVTSIPPNKAVLTGDLVVRNVEIIKP